MAGEQFGVSCPTPQTVVILLMARERSDVLRSRPVCLGGRRVGNRVQPVDSA